MPPSDDAKRARPRPRTSDITMPTGLDAILDGVAAAPVLEVHVPLRAGERVGDREQFVVVEAIGRGGMSHVYLARDAQLGRRVALKVLTGTSPEARDLFEEEARKTAGLQHPHIVTLHEAGLHDGRPYLVLEHLRGETLAERLRRGPIPPREALILAGQIAAAMAHAHAAGLVHRDLKPQNVFLVDGAYVKVLDFGIAALMHHAEDGAGTPVYMAPEQRNGDAVDARTDIWALGALLYECVTGVLAANANAAEATGGPTRPVPAAIAPVINRALKSKPEDRHPNAAVLADDIERALIMLATDVETPYRYLQSFGEEQSEWFLGRRREAARLRSAVAQHQVVVLAGQSGAGKSSILAAGLVPRLRSEGWNVLSLSPSRNPVGALANVVRRAGGTVDEEAWMRWPGVAASALSGLALARPNLSRELDAPSGRRPARRRAEIVEEPTQQTVVTPVSVAIAIHDAEELVTRADPAEALAFATILAAACDNRAVDFHVVLTLRTDYLDRLASSPLLREDLAHIHLLDAPDDEALRAAIVEPARRLGYRYEEGLAEEVIAAVRSERAPLPLLQFAASRLWELRDEENGVVPRAALGKLGGLGGLLAQHAESVYVALPSAAAQATAQALLTRLLTPQGVPRELELAELLADLPEDARSVLDSLAAARVVSIGRDVVTIGHETIARRWERLRGWIGESAGDRAFTEQLAQATTHWDSGGRAGGLLWSGDALVEARKRAPGLGGLELEFYRACERQARAQTWARRAVWIGLTVLSLAAIGAAVVASASRQDVTDAHARARSRELAGAAVELLERDPELAIVLARRAVLRKQTPEAVSALHAALRRNLPVREVGGFEKGVTAIGFAPGGGFVVAGGKDGAARIVPVPEGAPVALEGHTGSILSVSVDPDGRILTASADGSARLWASSGAALATVRHGEGSVYSAAFRPHAQEFVTAGADGTFRVWGPDGAERSRGSIGATNQVWHASFLPDGAHVLTGFQPALQGRFLGVTPRAHDVRVFRADGSLVHAIVEETDRHYSAATVTLVPGTSTVPSRLLVAQHPGVHRMVALDGTQLARFEGHTGVVWQLAASADGSLIAGGSNDRTVRVWRDTGALLTVLRGHGGLVRAVAFHPDGEHILTSCWDGLTRLFDREGELVGTFADGGSATARLSPDGRFVVTSGPQSLRVWETLPTPVGTVDLESNPAVVGARGAHVYINGKVGTQVFDASEMAPEAVWKGRTVRAAAANASVMFAVRSDGTLARLKVEEDGVSVRESMLEWPITCTPSTAALAGDVTAAGCSDGQIGVWTSAGKPAFKGRLAAAVNALAVHPRGYVVAGSHTGNVSVWNVAGAEVCSVRAHEQPIWSVVAVGDGFATASSDATARIWGPDCTPRATLKGHDSGIVYAAATPDGGLLVTASWDGTARTWEPDGTPVARFVGHEDTVTWAGFSADQKLFATTSGDDTARLWLPDGTPVTVLAGHSQGVLSGVFAAEGRRFVSVSRDGTAVSHLTDVEELLARAASRAMREPTPEERMRYHLAE
jgi:WD40 repeat protein/serine/threonine protein kinase